MGRGKKEEKKGKAKMRKMREMGERREGGWNVER